LCGLHDPADVAENHARLIAVTGQNQNHPDLAGRQVGFEIVEAPDENAGQRADPRLAASSSDHGASFFEPSGSQRIPACAFLKYRDLIPLHLQAEHRLQKHEPWTDPRTAAGISSGGVSPYDAGPFLERLANLLK
jgi:hypothetical protein